MIEAKIFTPKYKSVYCKKLAVCSSVGRCFIAGGLRIVGMLVSLNVGRSGGEIRIFSRSVDRFRGGATRSVGSLIKYHVGLYSLHTRMPVHCCTTTL